MMKSLRSPAAILALLYVCFLKCWSWSALQLPERVASHFNGSGEPNGWMSRSANQMSMLVFGLVFPLFVVVLCSLMRFLPASLINLPDKDYWLAPERRGETFNYLVEHSLWFSCMAVCFVIGLQYSIVQANRQMPPHLSSALLLALAGLFLAGTGGWVVSLLRHFRQPR